MTDTMTMPAMPAAKQLMQSAGVDESSHCTHRLFEWITSGMMLGIALDIAYSPHAIAAGGFHLLQNLGLTPRVLIAFFLITGLARLGSLYANGHLPIYGPWCRVACAALGAFIWAQMMLSLVVWSEAGDYLSIGVPVYFFLMVGEIVSSAMAAKDGWRG